MLHLCPEKHRAYHHRLCLLCHVHKHWYNMAVVRTLLYWLKLLFIIIIKYFFYLIKCMNVSVIWLAVWLSGNALAWINAVALHQTGLVPGWVTVCGRVNHVGMYQPTRSTQPSTFCGTVRWVSAFGLSNNINGDGWCSFWQPVQADSQPKSSGLVLGRRPLVAILHSSNEPGELSQWLCHDDSTMMTAP